MIDMIKLSRTKIVTLVIFLTIVRVIIQFLLKIATVIYIVSCHDYYKLRDGTIWLDILKNNFTDA